MTLFRPIVALLEYFLKQIVSRNLEVVRYFSQNSRQSPDAQRSVIRNGHMMFTVFSRGQSHMTTGLSSYLIAKFSEGFRKIASREIAWKPHSLGGNSFFSDEMKANYFWRLAGIKMAAH